MKHLGYLLVAFPLVLICANRQAASQTLQDKTLVVWSAPANADPQAACSALTIDDGQSHFDGIVFGSMPRKWMAGSDGFSRTWKNQKDWPDETADKRTFVQIAIVYRGREATIYRNESTVCPLCHAGSAASLDRLRLSCSDSGIWTRETRRARSQAESGTCGFMIDRWHRRSSLP